MSLRQSTVTRQPAAGLYTTRSPAARQKASACNPKSPHRHQSKCWRVRAVLPKEEDSGGTDVLEKPGFDRSQETGNAIPDQYYGSTENPPGRGLGGGDWRVMLLDDPKHTEPLVVKAICTVVSCVGEQQAKNCFHTSRQLGQALIVSCLKEHAEFFTQMINRQGVRSIIEPDTTTL